MDMVETVCLDPATTLEYHATNQLQYRVCKAIQITDNDVCLMFYLLQYLCYFIDNIGPTIKDDFPCVSYSLCAVYHNIILLHKSAPCK